MRISDWSSDVCSSDLLIGRPRQHIKSNNKARDPMKNIVIIRGPQGSGKSSLVRRLGLEGHHLSFDKVREVVAGDTINIDGMMTIPQQHNVLVWEMTQESLKRRMPTG